MNIYIYKIKHNYNYLHLKKYVPKFKQEYINSFEHKKDIDSHLMSYVVLQYIFFILFKWQKYPVFTINKYGKPYLKNKHVFFNISQTDNYIAIAINNYEVGIDINELEKYSKSFAKYAFTDKEISKINKSKNKDFAFTKAWTIKESYLKYLGTGLRNCLNKIEVKDTNIFVKKYSKYILSCSSRFKNVKIIKLNHEKIIDWTKKYFLAK